MLSGRIILLAVLFVLAGAGVLFVRTDHVINVTMPAPVAVKEVAPVVKKIDPNADIEPQPQLANPPETIKGLYATGYSAGSEKKVKYFLDLLNTTELNAIVIDIKDYTGDVSYKTEIPQVNQYNAWERKIPRINALIKRFHDAGVYVIGRIAVFQDKKLVLARPDLALHSSSTGGVWGDNKKVNWLDTSSRDVWDYNIAIAKDALARGFDEINFDYIRFASDGNLKDIVYPFYDGKTPKYKVVEQFFQYVRDQLPGAKLSADLFGLTTINNDDLGIGQKLEAAFPSFDYVAPMTYPSHYANGFINIPNPATQPYEVVKYSMDRALTKLVAFDDARIEAARKMFASSSEATSGAVFNPDRAIVMMKFRPWIQDFNLGADYTADMVRAQMNAIADAQPLASTTLAVANMKNGWLLWNPSNVYTKAALLAE